MNARSSRYGFLLLLTFCVGLSGAVQAAPLVYTEPPDLTGNLAIPDNLGPVDLGTNTITGSVASTADGSGAPASGDDADSFEYEVPAGMVATSVELVISNFTTTLGGTGRARTFSGGTATERFSADITYPNLIDTASGFLVPGIYDFQVHTEHPQDDQDNEVGDISYDWQVNITVEEAPTDIGLSASASIDPVVAGSGPDNLVVVLTAANNGPADATGVVVDTTWTLPTGVVPTSWVPSQGTVDDLGVWDIGPLTVAQGDVTLTATMTVGPETVSGTDVISGSAIVSAVDQVDWNAANDTVSQAISVRETSATFRVAKEFVEADASTVNMTLTCNDIVVDSGTVTDGNFVSLTVNGFLQDGFGQTNCVVTEEIPAGWFPSYSADCDVIAEDGAANATDGDGVYACTVTNARTATNFNVTKTFDDGNTSAVEVTLTCNTGLPLTQTHTIAGGDPVGVSFVVTNYVEGEMSCAVTETGSPDGYTVTYNGCSWENVNSADDHTCIVENTVDDVTFTVNKVWNFPNEGSDTDTTAEITISCNSEITTAGAVQDGNMWTYTETTSGVTDMVVADVTPMLPYTICSATENIDNSAVEPDASDCSEKQLSAGNSNSCTITNTVFFEGIPTLNQYGLAVLAILMLGLGLLGFRRFA